MKDNESLPPSAASESPNNKNALGDTSPESERSKDALLAAVSESSETDLRAAADAEPPAGQAPGQPAPKRRRWISLFLELLLVVALVGVCWIRFTNRGLQTWAAVCNSATWESLWNGSKMEAEQQAAATLKKRGAMVIAEPPDRRVTNVNMQGLAVDDELMMQVASLYRLTALNAARSKVTDDQLRCLDNLTHLAGLNLMGTAITDAGLAHLHALENLESLQLASTRISDRGLPAIANLHNLKSLDLTATQLTDTGLKQLTSLANLQVLILADTQVSDAGLRELAAMKNLRRVVLGNKTKVTRPGVVRLRKAIPGLVIEKAND
jgi:Leucine-rich repeat (LRR) protein